MIMPSNYPLPLPKDILDFTVYSTYIMQQCFCVVFALQFFFVAPSHRRLLAVLQRTHLQKEVILLSSKQSHDVIHSLGIRTKMEIQHATKLSFDTGIADRLS